MLGSREAPSQTGATVLVTDDSAETRRMTRQLLEERGYQVSEAGNGKLALDALRREKIDLLMTDLVMPDMDGIETIIAVRQEFPNVPILAVSGFSQAYLDGAMQMGAHATLSKPFKVEELMITLERLLSGGPKQ